MEYQYQETGSISPGGDYPRVRLEPMSHNRLARIEIWSAVIFAMIIMGALVILKQKSSTIEVIETKIEQGTMDRKKIEGALKVIEDQNQRSMEDRAYLHGELKNTRESLMRLEGKVKGDGDNRR